MNKNKIKWLYQERIGRGYRIFSIDQADTFAIPSFKPRLRYNLPIFRSKSGILRALKINDICKEFNLKRFSEEEIRGLDSWEDDCVKACHEANSWKRNSKRKHQWKYK